MPRVKKSKKRAADARNTKEIEPGNNDSTHIDQNDQVTTVAFASSGKTKSNGLITRKVKKLYKKKSNPKGKKIAEQRFRFLDLPIEVRLMIYKINLTDKRGLVRLFHRSNPFLGDVKRANLGINILLTSKQIYYEAIDFLYSQNTFCILPALSAKKKKDSSEQTCTCMFMEQASGENHNHATNLLKNMGAENRARIRKVEIQLLVPYVCCTKHYLRMKTWLPKLDSQVLFFDHYSEVWWRPEAAVAFSKLCNALPKLLPTTKSTSFDFTLLSTGRWPQLKGMAALMQEGFEALFPTELPRSESIFVKSMHKYEEAFDEHDAHAECTLLRLVGDEVEYWEPGPSFYNQLDDDGERTDNQSEADYDMDDFDHEEAAWARWHSNDPVGFHEFMDDSMWEDTDVEEDSYFTCSGCGEVHEL